MRCSDGWLEPAARRCCRAGRAEAIAVAATVPMALRGAVEVASYAPSALPDASDDLLARVAALYAERPAAPRRLGSRRSQTRTLTGDISARRQAATPPRPAQLAARLLAGEDGARIAMIETGGWDTHAGQRGRLGGAAARARRDDRRAQGRARRGLGEHDGASSRPSSAAPSRVNGTGGTDHGTASLAMLFGGAVERRPGGRRLAGPRAGARCYEGRDLRPTLALDTLLASAVAQHYRLDPARAAGALFPNIAATRGVEGLVRA